MRCTKCGHKLRIGDEFCAKCGTAIAPDIVYDENDARDDFDSQYEYEDDYQSEHDITGEIHLDPTDTRPKKASNWTTKGIIAAISIASAFVIAIIALNVQNMLKAKEDALDISEVQETTVTKESLKETTDEDRDNYYDDSSDYESDNNSVGEDILDFFEGIGTRIKDTAEDYGERLDESINNYRENMSGIFQQ